MLLKKWLYTFRNGDTTKSLVNFNNEKFAVIIGDEWFPVEDYGNYFLSDVELTKDEALNRFMKFLKESEQ